MVRGTTPSITLHIDQKYNVNLNEALTVLMTITQGHYSVTKSGEDIVISEDGLAVSAYLDQKESLDLQDSLPAEVQINWTYNDNGTVRRGATKATKFDVSKQLYRKVIA